MICFVDLPNLTSIYSEGGSFYEPHSVILESIFKVQLLWYIDIPNLQNVNLPDSFKKVKAKSILSIFGILISLIDVSFILAGLVNI